jgi:two-component system, NtrC family, response regulator AtoC
MPTILPASSDSSSVRDGNVPTASGLRLTSVVVPAYRNARKPRGCDDAAPIVAHNGDIVRVFALARRAARSELPVLVLGETGTGKEVVACAIHESSPRAERAFRVVNCGALAASLMESALFGHEKGAFTGASQAHAGLFEQANGGTLFLDEVGELSPAAQVALLRVLETKTLTRLGASGERKVDVRVVAATHRDLPTLCADGRFREDLLHRLNAVTLRLPPLRERREEVPIFVERFLRSRDLPGDCVRAIAPEALARLCAYHWPGNVRQLKNVVERAAVLAFGQAIEIEDLPEELRSAQVAADQPGPRSVVSLQLVAHESRPSEHGPVESALPFRERLQQHEAELIRRALAQVNDNRTQAAELLRMPLRTLMKRLKEYRIT